MASIEHLAVTGTELPARDVGDRAVPLGPAPSPDPDGGFVPSTASPGRADILAVADRMAADPTIDDVGVESGSGSLSVVMGAYNEEAVLRSTVVALLERLRFHPGSEIIVVENGSTDGTAALADALQAEFARHPVPMRAAHTSKGLGVALRMGILLARADRILITGADLPFGFSDLDAALALDPQPPLVLGSKAHRDSIVEVGLGRRVLSSGYRMLRGWVLDLGVRDPQGTILIDRQIAQALLPRLHADGYFIETELVARAAWLGYQPVEVPVRYFNPRVDSKVQPVRDSWDMLRSMFRLRAELRRELGANQTAVPRTGTVPERGLDGDRPDLAPTLERPRLEYS